MNTSLNEFIAQIPKDKLAEIANGLAADATAQHTVEALAAAGVQATEEQARALLESLYGGEDEAKGIPDEKLDAVAGGYTTYTKRYTGMIAATDEWGNQLTDQWGTPLWKYPCHVCGE